MLLIAANMVCSFLVIPKSQLCRIIIKFFKIRPPIVVVVLDICPCSSVAVNHINSKIVALMSRLHVFERFMNWNQSLNQEKRLLVKDLQLNHGGIDKLLQRLASIRSQYFGRSIPISKNSIFS